MTAEINIELIQKITELQQLYVALISCGIIQFKSSNNRDLEMNKWVLDHFDSDVSDLIYAVNDIYVKHGLNKLNFEYL